MPQPVKPKEKFFVTVHCDDGRLVTFDREDDVPEEFDPSNPFQGKSFADTLWEPEIKEIDTYGTVTRYNGARMKEPSFLFGGVDVEGQLRGIPKPPAERQNYASVEMIVSRKELYNFIRALYSSTRYMRKAARVVEKRGYEWGWKFYCYRAGRTRPTKESRSGCTKCECKSSLTLKKFTGQERYLVAWRWAHNHLGGVSDENGQLKEKDRLREPTKRWLVSHAVRAVRFGEVVKVTP
jgi:hypothetical protein